SQPEAAANTVSTKSAADRAERGSSGTELGEGRHRRIEGPCSLEMRAGFSRVTRFPRKQPEAQVGRGADTELERLAVVFTGMAERIAVKRRRERRGLDNGLYRLPPSIGLSNRLDEPDVRPGRVHLVLDGLARAQPRSQPSCDLGAEELVGEREVCGGRGGYDVDAPSVLRDGEIEPPGPGRGEPDRERRVHDIGEVEVGGHTDPPHGRAPP